MLILPDIHGRDFWRKPVQETLKEGDEKIIFLGDYLDPYPHEWDKDVDYRKIAIERFKEIIELKRNNTERVTLLLGNHDCGYCIGDDVCSCRMDHANRHEIEKLFNDNRGLFQIAEEADLNGKHFVFSHAGILKGWAELVWGEEGIKRKGFNVVEELNNAWFTNHYGILDSLANCDTYRDWGGFKYGSPVWSDIRSWANITPEDTYGFNIVGHTQCIENPVVLETIADLDCRKAFILNSEAELMNYDTKEKTQLFKDAKKEN